MTEPRILETDDRVVVESVPMGNGLYAWQITGRSPTDVEVEMVRIMSDKGVLRSEFRPVERQRGMAHPTWQTRGFTEVVPLIGGANVVREQERAA